MEELLRAAAEEAKKTNCRVRMRAACFTEIAKQRKLAKAWAKHREEQKKQTKLFS